MNYLKDTLELALGLKRPHAGKSVRVLKDYLLATLPAAYEDTIGNIHCTVGNSRTLFSAHTDTVHRDDGKNSYLLCDEQIITDGKAKLTRTMYRGHGAVLGADDGAGCALLVHLAMNNVPGHYVFHHAEEVGGIGSTALAASKAFIGLFDRAIAFDRKSDHSVITRQSGGNCCSQLFAGALCDALNAGDESFMFCPDDGGVYTDTAEYIDQIAECTNVSCGYYSEHSNSESLDYSFLERLAASLLTINFEALPIGVRDIEPVRQSYFSDWGSAGLAVTFPKDVVPDYNDISPYWALDSFYDMIDQYEDVFVKFTDAEIDEAAGLLGDEGIWRLIDDVDSGFMDMAGLENALRSPTAYLQAEGLA